MAAGARAVTVLGVVIGEWESWVCRDGGTRFLVPELVFSSNAGWATFRAGPQTMPVDRGSDESRRAGDRAVS